MTTQSLLAGLSLATLTLLTAGAAPVAPPPLATPKRATTADLGGENRFLSYLSTDKPIYRPTEKLYARALLLNAATHQPLADNQNVNAIIQIVGPKGDVVTTSASTTQNSIAAFNWTVPDSASGGEYTLKVTYPSQGYAPAERKFDVRVYRAPRLKSQVAFVREGYGPGDKVLASLHTERAEGGFPAGAKVTITARVDETQVFTTIATLDAKGDCSASFDLPKTIARGEGTLAFSIQDGGTVETAAKTIPILLQTLDISFYPEGGDAVAGVSNRFYLEAKTPNKKPADLVGGIYDSKNNKIADVKTQHEGRARFAFTPAKDETYTLKLIQPAGITKTWALPAAKETGVILQTFDDVVAKDQPLRVEVTEQGVHVAKVTLSRHEIVLGESQEGLVKHLGTALHTIQPKDNTDGVLTLTAWDDKGQPLAERLVYRQPAHQINIAVTPDQSTYTPGGKPTLNITTTDDSGKPVSAVVGLTVTDDSVLEMIEKREQAPRLPVMVLLEPEVRDLADAHVYLDPNNPKAALATDLLLGTQGWRRFALINTTDFLSKYGDDASRALALVKPAPPQPPMDAMAFDGPGGGEGGNGRARVLRMAPPVNEDDMADLKLKATIPENNKQLVDLQPLAKANEAADKEMVAKDAREEGFAGGGRFAAKRINPNLIMIRQFAHELRTDWSPANRSDFTETVFWSADIKTDDQGHATSTFALSDAVTSFRINADAFSKSGALGTSTSTFNALQPFYIEPKLPLEVTTGDIIQLPIAMNYNAPDQPKMMLLTIAPTDGLAFNPQKASGSIIPDAKHYRQLWDVSVANKTGDLPLVFSATAGTFSDNVTRKLRVRPNGFPTQIAYGGLLNPGTSAQKTFTIPVSLVPNSMETAITVYSSPMANLTDAVAALMREPNGCFEQTSSTNYPLAMAQQYFITHQGIDPQLIAKSNALLAKGYEHLIGFECNDKGYEWFGGHQPGHEALTAYGIMEFSDMQAAHLALVDPQMIERTRTWILSRRDGKGGFQRNAKSLDSFGGAPALTTDAYIVWALLQAGEKTLDPEIKAVTDAAKASDDSYVLALAANIATLRNDTDSATWFLDKLAHAQNKEGAVDGAKTSITRSGGQALAIETTSLASLAWMQGKNPKYAANAMTAIKFLADSCKGGRFGSTQSTILALKAITAYDQSQAHPKAAGSITLLIDGNPSGNPIPFTADTKEPLKFPNIADTLTSGEHTVALQMDNGSQMPFSIAITYNSTTPATDKECKVQLETWLKDAQLVEGNITEARVLLTNPTDKDAASPIAIIGIPGGLEVRHDQLKELVKSGKIDAYEVNGREVVLYWRQLKAKSKADLALSLTAAIPGTYTAPASRAYEYYTDELKQWTEGTTIKITPK